MLEIGQLWQDKKQRIFQILDITLNPYEQMQYVVFSVNGDSKHLTMGAEQFQVQFQQIEMTISDLNGAVELYKSVFKARNDVYASRWFNKELQKWVYSPAKDYNTGDILPINDYVIKQHLLGKKFIGFYPMGADNRTMFLVLDFDKQNWRDIVPAIRAVLAEIQLQSNVEISQSGEGAHVWFFFVNPVLAVHARQLGQLILQRAMQMNPHIRFDAFDRMIPHQDVLPQKGFGNLIAAPLNGQRVDLGRSVFIDENFVPFKNQWLYINRIVKIYDSQMFDVIQKLQVEIEQVMLALPTEQVELEVEINRNLTIKLDNISDLAVQQLRNLAVFNNPEYFKLIKSRRSVYKTPRYLSFSEFGENELILPRGLFRRIRNDYMLSKVTDARNTGRPLEVSFNGQLYPEQLDALEGMLEADDGVVVARTGFGKTVVAAALIAERKVSTLIVVPKNDLGNQWHRELERFLSIDSSAKPSFTKTGRPRKIDSKIGQYLGQKKIITELVDIVTIQSLEKMTTRTEFLSKYGMVIFDEVHHTAAYTYDQVVGSVAAKYMYGMTATFERADGLTPLIKLRFGEILYESAKIEQKTLLNVRRQIIIQHTEFGQGHHELAEATFIQINQELTFDETRNQQIIDRIKENSGQKQLVLVNRVAHAERLVALMKENSLDVELLTGRMPTKRRNAVLDKIKHMQQPFVLIATGSIAGEGLDVPDLTVLHLTTPRSFPGTIVQYLGRLERNLSTKAELTVIDYVDAELPMLARMYLKRLATYRKLGWRVKDEHGVDE
ncbi:MAG: DEAD/DEAH box helicase [Lactobacillaceae bacterium]|jgi:superfamily II DNA or RNA helicase|nr:DEAD/DEAH box helicase [Lactobacillaceae bacterium]